jgi:predicted nucleotidyltransferase
MNRTLAEETFARLRDVLQADPDVEIAALFGSAACGRLRAGSDVDIYVKLRKGASWSPHQELSLASELSAAAGREVDLTLEDEERTSVILRLEVARHGLLLCERCRGAWVELRARAMLAYADIEPWMRHCGEGVRRVLASRLEETHAR